MKGPSEAENAVPEEQGDIVAFRSDTTQRGLKSRHAQMIALGGTIGTALFVGSGQSLHMGGPAFLVTSYVLLTLLVFGIVTATTEMSSYLPVPGCSMAYYADRFHSRSLGFALGWLYCYVFVIEVPAEITAATLIVQYWNPGVHVAVWISIFLVLMVVLNCFPVRVYGETEFWFAAVKVMGIIGLLVMAMVLIFGGGPKHELLGFHYWKHPSAVNEHITTGDSGRLCAFVSTVSFSMFAFAFAPELLVVTGGEMENPRQNLPKAGIRYFYRLVIFYVLGAIAISMIVPSNHPQLLGGGSGAGASPWAIAARIAGIQALDSIINIIILLSALSSGNSFLYLATRSLYSLALAGNAPRIFARCTKTGVPYYAVAACSAFSALAYLNISNTGAIVFNWFVNLINTGGFQSWICVCIVYLRFRKATAAQGVTDLPFRSRFQPYMAYICGSLFTLLLLLNGYANFLSGQWSTSNFLTAYIGIPIFLAFYLGHRFFVSRADPWVLNVEEVDMVSGLPEILASETTEQKSARWYQFWKVLYE
jgi:amino acid transporter